jgi:hypothetical protein
LRFYGLDLRDEYETAGVRRLWALIKGLPRDSATWAGEHRWTQELEFLAELIEITDIASHRMVAAMGGTLKGDPIQIERPFEDIQQEVRKEITVTTDTQEIARWFALHS